MTSTETVMTDKVKIMLLSKCAVYNSKRLRLQEASKLIRSLGSKASLVKFCY